MAVKRWLIGCVLAGLIVWSGGTGDGLRACGPFYLNLVLANAVFPADPVSYADGRLGVVQPRYARQYLVLAYRRMMGVAPAGADRVPVDERNPGPQTAVTTTPTATPRAVPPRPASPFARWLDAANAIAVANRPSDGTNELEPKTTKDRSNYNACGDDAFATATATLSARVTSFGAASPGVRDWVSAQRAVFANCSDRPSLSLPAPLPPGLPAVFAADRAYQLAAAHFYGESFDTAERMFRAIGNDRTSPWQSKGRYLAARALIRRATLHETEGAALATLQKADAELAGILADPALSSMHRDAESLRHFVQTKLHPADRLHAVARALATAAQPDPQDYVDYTRLVDQLVDVGVTYDYGTLDRALAQTEDLTDWVTSMQGQGAAGVARAIAQWKSKQTMAWLVAALWRVDPASADAAAVLTAAAAVPNTSPAYPTVVFTRARLLIARGELASARALLMTAPDAPASGFTIEAVNLLRSLRMRTATTLDEFMKASVRRPVQVGYGFEDAAATPVADRAVPTFDVDAAIAFTEQLPLTRLLEAATSRTLPDRLRVRVAIAAWTRAVQLRHDEVGLAVAPLLVTLAPALKTEMARYTGAATADERHNAAVLTLLRWPGLRNYVRLVDERDTDTSPEPRNTLAGPNWWANFDTYAGRAAGPYDWSTEQPVSSLPDVVGDTTHSVPPAFLSQEERVANASEWQRLKSLGAAPTYLAREAASWATASPKDPNVAEALARAVKATRYGCGDAQTGKASQQAFSLLHKLFPNSSWAKETPFWYEGR